MQCNAYPDGGWMFTNFFVIFVPDKCGIHILKTYDLRSINVIDQVRNLIYIMADDLLALTYSEFDNQVGPQLRYQYPLDVVSAEDFENISDYVIVGKHLCGKTIVVRNEYYQFVNFSVAIDNKKYDRNALLFAVGVVLSINANSDIYRSLLSRFAATLVALETESEYLFKKETKQSLQYMLESAYIQLKSTNYAFLRFDDANTLVVEFFENPMHPETVHDDDVPMLLLDKISIAGLPWDITIQHLLCFINGENNVRAIAKCADMDSDCVRRCFQVLLFYKCILMTDSFQFSNIYAITSMAYDLCSGYIEAHDIDLLHATEKSSAGDSKIEQTLPSPIKQCGEEVVNLPNSNININSANANLINEILEFCCIRLETMESVDLMDGQLKFPLSLVHDLIHIVFLFQSDVSVKDVVLKCFTSTINGKPYNYLHNIDIRKLCAICVSKRVLRRVRLYPVYNPSVTPSNNLKNSNSKMGKTSAEEAIDNARNNSSNNRPRTHSDGNMGINNHIDGSTESRMDTHGSNRCRTYSDGNAIFNNHTNTNTENSHDNTISNQHIHTRVNKLPGLGGNEFKGKLLCNGNHSLDMLSNVYHVSAEDIKGGHVSMVTK